MILSLLTDLLDVFDCPIHIKEFISKVKRTPERHRPVSRVSEPITELHIASSWGLLL